MGAPGQQRRAIQNKAFQTLIQKLLSNGENAHSPDMGPKHPRSTVLTLEEEGRISEAYTSTIR